MCLQIRNTICIQIIIPYNARNVHDPFILTCYNGSMQYKTMRCVHRIKISPLQIPK